MNKLRIRILRLLIRLRVISEAYGYRLMKRNQFFEEIENTPSLIAETSLLGLPFYYEPYRTTRDEVFGPSGLKKILDKDNYRLCLLHGKDVPVILDIGSHIGIFPRVIKHRFPRARIYSLEPDRDNYRVLRLNNDMISEAESFQYGVYDSQKQIRLVASDQNSWRSSLDINTAFFRKELIGNDSYSYDSYEVSCVSIDYFIESQGISSLDMIGLTVPGEIAIQILTGALKSIKLFRPIVSIGLYPSEVASVLRLMHSLGYIQSDEPVGSMYAFVSE